MTGVLYKEQKVISHSSGGWKFKINGLVGSLSIEDLISASKMAT